MTIQRHGLSVGIERISDDIFILSLTLKGKLTHNDYQIMTDMLEQAIASVKQPHIKVLVDARELDGWELRAAWDDFKMGLKHGGKFTQIALIGNRRWQELGSKIGSWFIAGEVKYFEDLEPGLEWLNSQ